MRFMTHGLFCHYSTQFEVFLFGLYESCSICIKLLSFPPLQKNGIFAPLVFDPHLCHRRRRRVVDLSAGEHSPQPRWAPSGVRMTPKDDPQRGPGRRPCRDVEAPWGTRWDLVRGRRRGCSSFPTKTHNSRVASERLHKRRTRDGL